MSSKTTAVHVTHEAIGKIGGIGAVLEGLFTSNTYQQEISRTILVSPLFSTEGDATTRLGPGGEPRHTGVNADDFCSLFHEIDDPVPEDVVRA